MTTSLAPCLLFFALFASTACAQEGLSTATGQVAPDHPVYVIKPGGDVKALKLTHSVDPAYTNEAKRNRVEGRCTIQFVVDVNGIPKDVTLFKSIADDLPADKQKYAAGLDASAVHTVGQFRFRPGTLKGQPVAVKITALMNFKLDHQGFF